MAVCESNSTKILEAMRRAQEQSTPDQKFSKKLVLINQTIYHQITQIPLIELCTFHSRRNPLSVVHDFGGQSILKCEVRSLDAASEDATTSNNGTFVNY